MWAVLDTVYFQKASLVRGVAFICRALGHQRMSHRASSGGGPGAAVFGHLALLGWARLCLSWPCVVPLREPLLWDLCLPHASLFWASSSFIPFCEVHGRSL